MKMTRKEILNSGYPVIAIPYCKAQHMLRAYDRVGYTSGTYGWNADVYFIDGVYIVTGYRPFFNTGRDDEALENAETYAQQINRSDLEYCKKVELLRRCCKDFIEACIL
ncbi:MAG: hypothetical protein IJZ63_04260 [Clostridia bacterium]|nr:hypothetical protein [Clostridia bacterium]